MLLCFSKNVIVFLQTLSLVIMMRSSLRLPVVSLRMLRCSHTRRKAQAYKEQVGSSRLKPPDSELLPPHCAHFLSSVTRLCCNPLFQISFLSCSTVHQVKSLLTLSRGFCGHWHDARSRHWHSGVASPTNEVADST